MKTRIYYTFFYKQLVYKQLASLKMAKQLSGLNHLAISNNIKLQITENRFAKDCSGVNQSSKVPTPHPLLLSVKTGTEYCMILRILQNQTDMYIIHSVKGITSTPRHTHSQGRTYAQRKIFEPRLTPQRKLEGENPHLLTIQLSIYYYTLFLCEIDNLINCFSRIELTKFIYCKLTTLSEQVLSNY